ncbi:FAD-binding dehydrogenase [Lewinella cohaerens]|uniref:FAD-binding dehydrogenase n=1 Tax=Lewinella cohaerens TaxID=70995 RepID=UPI00036CB636|nr:FAD-binding dehydrogenase [Lewinella cohaerens]
MSSTLHYQSDVIIVGAGIAGIIAAIELLDAGKRVLILDRDVEHELGGLAKWAFGGMFFVDTKHQRRNGIKDSIELARQDWYNFADFAEDEYWGKQWADQYLHLCTDHGYHWLRKNGIDFFRVLNWAERGLNNDGNSVPRFHMVWGTGWELVQVFKRKLLEHKNSSLLSIHYEHRVLELLGNSQGIQGVQGQLEGSDTEFSAVAETVIVATGGINGNIEKIRENWFSAWGKPPKVILNGAHKYALGDLHDATAAIDGNVVNLDKQWNYAAGIRHYAPRKKDHGLSLVPCKTALWLNYRGERMGPEPLVTAYDTRYLVERICEEEEKYSWQVLNYGIMLKEFAISGSEHNPAFRDKKFLKVIKTVLLGNKELVNKMITDCEDVLVADTLEELVDKMNALQGTDAVQLQDVKAAVAAYDGSIDQGPPYRDKQQQRIQHARQWRGDKARTSNMVKIGDLKKGPFVAIREFILSRKSLGGIQTDLGGRVLQKPDGAGVQAPIPGLYAIGEAAGFGGGGMHGHRSLEGTFLGGCVITARVTAQAILGKTL